jgi:SSS family solute:Na+ symporter
MTRAGATVSVLLGFAASMFWLIFVHEKEAKAIGLCELLTGKATLVADATPMSFAFLLQWVDPNVVALPISFVLAVVVSLATKRFTDEHLAHCFKHIH